MRIIVSADLDYGDRSVYGPFWVEHEGFSFPCADWVDLGLGCLRWWLEIWRSRGSETCVQFRFLDGPFYFEINLVDHKLTFFEEGGTQRIAADFDLEPKDWEQNLMAASKQLVAIVESNGWSSDDTLEIKDHISNFESK